MQYTRRGHATSQAVGSRSASRLRFLFEPLLIRIERVCAPETDSRSLAGLKPLSSRIDIFSCGHGIAQRNENIHCLTDRLQRNSFQAVRNGRVYIADGNKYLNSSCFGTPK
jgi:hypothetical protein